MFNKSFPYRNVSRSCFVFFHVVKRYKSTSNAKCNVMFVYKSNFGSDVAVYRIDIGLKMVTEIFGI